jgi:hypothetical protein
VCASGCEVDAVRVDRDCGCDVKPFMYCVADGVERCDDDVPDRDCGCDANPFTYRLAGAERSDCAVERDTGTPGFTRVSDSLRPGDRSASGLGTTGVVFEASCVVVPRTGCCVDGRAPEDPLSCRLLDPARSAASPERPRDVEPADLPPDEPCVVAAFAGLDGFEPIDCRGAAGFATATLFADSFGFDGFAEVAGLPDLVGLAGFALATGFALPTGFAARIGPLPRSAAAARSTSFFATTTLLPWPFRPELTKWFP